MRLCSRQLIFLFCLTGIVALGQNSLPLPIPLTPNFGSVLVKAKAKQVFPHAKLILRLQNDSVISYTAEFNTRLNPNVITVKDSNDKPILVFKPGDTKSVVRKLPGGGTIKGIPADTCWLFKTIEGKIDAYSHLPVYSEENLIALKLGDGPIQRLNGENLSAIAPPDDKYMAKFIRQNKWVEAIRYYNRYVK